ncbi:hypothetical protein EDM56_09375 [Brevibacillus fluminis]|uniref:Uncharacterized protein n=1 Tax=Brevibacillus fluminis TaxID=511487 RepID=A0A3M8DT67_9BACL|nr:hypothetical protein [Brevibacillus fluminis]RNB90689.1 hypothetical protein EDM56_09375 [Brevibacillus fluminis]
MKDLSILLLSLLLLTGSSEIVPGQESLPASQEELGPIPAEVVWDGKTYAVSDQQLPTREIGTHLGQASFIRGTRMVYEIKGSNSSDQLAIKQMGKYYLLATSRR